METKKENKVKTVFGAVGIALLYLLIQLVVSIIASIIISVSVPRESMDNEALTAFVMSYQPIMVFVSNLIGTILFGIWYYLGYVKKDQLAGTYVPCLDKICNINAIGFIVFSALTIGLFDRHVADLVMMLSPESGEYFHRIMAGVSDPTPINLISMILLSSMGTAFAFPGIMMQNLKKTFGIAGCIIIPSILLAIIMLNPVQSIYGIPFSLVMMFVSYKFSSAIPGMMIGIINNAGAVILNEILKKELPPAISACFVVIFLGLSIFFYRRLPFSHKDESDIPSQSE
ncbi:MULTISPECIES: hypothetical protein [unclassified Butyrivibrio]|uniref:hypothetical protein n=1 Tax=unclassified Butyrivibrio TaxID=2639466 RepID=UPI0003B61AA6|nr:MULTISPECIES: hypothetical protein [unclassified Butyrivibrio]